MNRLHPWTFGFAAAATSSVFFTACAIAVALFPDGTIGFFNAWFHGLDLALLKPPGGRSLTLGQFVYGLVSVAVVSFAIAAVLAGFYNLFTRAFDRAEVVAEPTNFGRYVGRRPSNHCHPSP